MTPSMPVSEVDGVCPAEMQAAITTNPKVIRNLRKRIGQFTPTAAYRSKDLGTSTDSIAKKIGCPRITRINANGLYPPAFIFASIRVISGEVFSLFACIRVHSRLSQVGHLTTPLLRRKFSARLVHETLFAFCNCRRGRVSRAWKRSDALSGEASAAPAYS